MTIWIFAACLGALLWWAWHYLIVGEIRGQKMPLRTLLDPNVRLQLKLGRARKKLAECMELPPRERLRQLVKLEHEQGDVFLAGDDIRQAIVATGVSEAVPYIRQLLEAANLFRSHITSGVQEALSRGDAEEDYKVKVFQILLPCLDDPQFQERVTMDRLPALLFALDSQWAERVLKSDEYLTPDYRHFKAVLEAFNDSGVQVEREKLDNCVVAYSGRKLGFREGLAFIEVAKAVAFHDQSESKRLLTETMENQEEVATHAAEALLELLGLPHPRFRLDDKVSEVGINAVNEAERTVWLVDRYNYIISLGGLMMFEDDEEADHMKAMATALLKVGSHRNAERLEAFMKLFVPDGPASNAEGRAQQIKAFGDGWRAAVDAVNEAHQEYEDSALLALKYELAHADQFERRQSTN